VLSVRITVNRPRRDASEKPFTLDLAFDAARGITILFGPSGSGKSTTLSAIAGLLRPDAGRIALGDDVWFDSEKDIDRPTHQRGVAFVFQSLALFPHMTAIENVAYGMERNLPTAEKRKRARDLLARFKVPHVEGRRPSTFSGGEAQRVAIARAFAMAPRIALLDEPFSALDQPLRTELAADVRGFVDDLGILLVHVTHEKSEARALGDRVVVLEAGRVKGEGKVPEILRG
jgi:molybdate transport system ATP-binding protein